MYNCIFCARRFLFVSVNIFFSQGFPLTLYEQNNYLLKIVLFLLISSAYIAYIWTTRPHTESYYNSIELFNEGMLILVGYLMIPYSGIVPMEHVIKINSLVILALSITGTIVIVNFYIVIQLVIKKII